jgi:hypothetical protein
MRILIPTLQHIESDFYGRVGRLLKARGHSVSHLTCSRRAARALRHNGDEAWCLPDLVRGLNPRRDSDSEAERIVDRYPIRDLAEVYAIDPVCRRRPGDSAWAERTVGHFLAIEELFRSLRPEVVVSEVGSEGIREVSRLVAADQGATTLFPLYTIFDPPLRLCAETIDVPIVEDDELRPLTPAEDAELDDFIARFKARGRPIRDYRTAPITAARLRLILRHFAVRALWDRDNEYLRPGAWLARDVRHRVRARRAQRLYAPTPPDRSFLYFPLQVVQDYKILKLRPQCVDQEAIVGKIVSALPDRIDLVVKQHPISIADDETGMLRRLAAHPRVHLVGPLTSSIELIERSAGVVTTSSTVGFEAVLLGRPVLTIGRPFYSGFGVTVDVDGPDQIPRRIDGLVDHAPDVERTRRLMHAAMRRCHPGTPVLVDHSDENAERLAGTLDRAARGALRGADPGADDR